MIGVTHDHCDPTLLSAFKAMGVNQLHQPSRDSVEHLGHQLDALDVALREPLHQHSVQETLLGSGDGDGAGECAKPHLVSVGARQGVGETAGNFGDGGNVAGDQALEPEPIDAGETNPRMVVKVITPSEGVDVVSWGRREHARF